MMVVAAEDLLSSHPARVMVTAVNALSGFFFSLAFAVTAASSRISTFCRAVFTALRSFIGSRF